MKRISKPTSQYKKDLKRFRHDAALLSDLNKVDGELHILKLYRLGSHSELF